MTQSSKNKGSQSSKNNPWIELIQTIVTAAVLSLGIRTFIAEARYIPSSSMRPTLEVNDRLIIEKLSYLFREPIRGDVIVFNPTDSLKAENFQDAFIKRIIGLPGEIVEVKIGKVYVNGKKISEEYIFEAPDYNYGPSRIPEDEYLVLGDNRNNSYDSHYWGFVPKKKIIGKAFVRFWPFDRLGSLYKQPAYLK